jgi:hypothetical protein
MVRAERSIRDHAVVVAWTLTCFALLVGVLTVTPWSATDWRTVGLVVGVLLIASYGLHRYERVMLGLVREDES